jgi:hypothetical protein
MEIVVYKKLLKILKPRHINLRLLRNKATFFVEAERPLDEITSGDLSHFLINSQFLVIHKTPFFKKATFSD